MEAAIKKPTVPGGAWTEGPSPVAGGNARFSVAVVFTNFAATCEALKLAGTLARGLAEIRLVAVETVPFPLQLGQPARSPAFLQALLQRAAVVAQVSASIEIYLTRNMKKAIREVIELSSVVVLGGAERWWLSRARRLARWLKRRGYRVIYVQAVGGPVTR